MSDRSLGSHETTKHTYVLESNQTLQLHVGKGKGRVQVCRMAICDERPTVTRKRVARRAGQQKAS